MAAEDAFCQCGVEAEQCDVAKGFGIWDQDGDFVGIVVLNVLEGRKSIIRSLFGVSLMRRLWEESRFDPLPLVAEKRD
jgi:hypothetical protein